MAWLAAVGWVPSQKTWLFGLATTVPGYKPESLNAACSVLVKPYELESLSK